MKLSEIKAASNDDLIMTLAGLMARYKFTKQDAKTAERVADELIKRGIVSSDFKARYLKSFYS